MSNFLLGFLLYMLLKNSELIWKIIRTLCGNYERNHIIHISDTKVRIFIVNNLI